MAAPQWVVQSVPPVYVRRILVSSVGESQLFNMWALGIKLRPLCWQGNHFTNSAISLASWICTLNLISAITMYEVDMKQLTS